jgi:N6-adenosine-specific RNA methylase IME4
VGGIRRGALCAVLKDVFKVLGQFLVVMSRHKRKKENSSYQFMSANSLRATVEQLVDFSRLEFFFLWGHLQTRVYYASIKNAETLHKPIFSACRTIRNRPVTP